MNSRDKIISWRDLNRPVLTPAARPSVPDSDVVTAALDLVSETAAAIRELEKQSAQAVARAHDVANAVQEELERAETRAERAEEGLRLAEATVDELTTVAIQAREEIEALQSQLASTEAELAVAGRRAEDAEAAIEKIVHAIRSQLPANSSAAAEQAENTA